MHLIIGNKNYSSWSLRPWLGMKVMQIPFEETLVVLRQDDTQTQIARYSPAGKVPILLDGELAVWDSLAIAEYLAERFPETGLWPRDARARAYARSICAEMHAGFSALRNECPMDIRAQRSVTINEGLQKDIDRIFTIWSDCLRRFSEHGGFLFGEFSWADAFFAPVVMRFNTYGIKTPDEVRDYMDRILNLPPMQEWIDAARREPWVHAQT